MAETMGQAHESISEQLDQYWEFIEFWRTINELNSDNWTEKGENNDKKYDFNNLNWIKVEDIVKLWKLEINWESVKKLKEWESWYWYRMFQGDVFVWTWENWRIKWKWVVIYKDGTKYIWDLKWWDSNGQIKTTLNNQPYVFKEWMWTTQYKNGSTYTGGFNMDRYISWTFENNGIRLDISWWKVKAWNNALDLREVLEQWQVNKMSILTDLLKDTTNVIVGWKEEKKNNLDSDFFSSGFSSGFGSDLLSDEITLEKKDWSKKTYNVDFLTRWVKKEVLAQRLNDYIQNNK